ncbi:major facilitator superfamily transporter [Paramyrothecium foliicola]|nr:major facilitator superfamily transporter [Paramyrothecium foliicola]
MAQSAARRLVWQLTEATETTPLINGDDIVPNATAQGAVPVEDLPPAIATAKNPEDKPLPVMQILLLCYARLMEPIAFFSIIPFIAQMVQRNGNLPASDVGFYSGLIESIFSATQMFVLIFWGRLADRVGRKPVLIISLFGMAICPALFCMSKTIPQMFLFRSLAGVFSGSGLIIRTMIADHSTPKTQARAFSWFSFGGNVGIFIGPILGGVLADPVRQYPGAFKGIAFFEEYPYALSGFVIGLISLTGAIVSVLFLQETLPPVKKSQRNSTGSESTADEPSMWQLIRSPGVAFTLWLYNHVMGLAFIFTAIMPVALYMPVRLGGMGFGPSLIAAYMAIQGASQALWLLIAFPILHRRFGTKGVLEICAIVYPFFFAGYILLNLLLRDGSQTAIVWFWIIGFIVAVIGPGVSMAFTGVQLAINDVSPDPHVLGTLNAIALTASSGIRAILPGVSTVIYTVGVREQILGGQLAWVLLIPLALVFTVASRWISEPEKSNQPTTEGDDSA